MKRIIKGLYIAFFPQEYEASIQRDKDDLNARLRHTEDLLLGLMDIGDKFYSDEECRSWSSIIAKRREEEKKERDWILALTKKTI